jgi:hypothetical protein
MKPKSERDYRLDFCRGLALIVIFIDHVPHNPFADWTLHKFAFCDAAEVFVLISGMASYLAYGSKFDRFGFSVCAKAIGRRWTRVYLAHLLLFAALSTAMLLAAANFSGADYVGHLKLGWLLESPRQAVTAALTLRYLPTYLDILPLYLVLLGIAPLLIYLVKRDYRLALLLSTLLYAVVWMTGFNLQAGEHAKGWYFNPFAWQLLYTVGMVVIHVSKTAPEAMPWKKRWLGLALAFIVFGVISAAPWKTAGVAMFDLPLHWWPANKTFLAPLRVLNVLALLYVFAFFVPAQASMFRSPFAAPFLSCGRHSLSVYGVGVVLSCIGFVAISEASHALVVPPAVNFAGILILFVLAAVLDWRKTRGIRLPVAPAVLSPGGTGLLDPVREEP